MKHKKLLIISATPFRNDTNMGKTLCTLFSSFRPEELMQLYYSPQVPNVKVCSSYYQVNEKQLLRSVFGLRESLCGEIIHNEDIHNDYVAPQSNPHSILSLKKYTIVPILRDTLWGVSKWKSAKLKQWLSENRPDAVFCIMTDSVSSCSIVEYCTQICDCPLIMFVTDDYYNIIEQNPSFLRRWYQTRIQKAINKMAKKVKFLVGCSELASEEFGKKLNVPFDTVLTPSAPEYLAMPIKEPAEGKTVVFRYFGNLGLERWKPLMELGKAIVAYNNGERKAILEVYSSLTYSDAIAQVAIPNGCEFKGWVHGEEFMRLLQEADVAVHVESFSEAMCLRTRVSISTKIADYLGAGKCILAIGRQDLASIQHVEKVAYTVHDMLSLESAVKNLAEDSQRRKEYSIKARELSVSRHNQEKISQRMKSLIFHEIQQL